MSIKFCADLHLGHYNILRYCNRPFYNTYEMNEALITNWNQKVTNDDIVYFLGDFSMNHNVIPNFLPRLNRKKIILVSGNHDKPFGIRANKWDQVYIDYGFDEIYRLPIVMEFNGVSLVLSHFPYDNKDPRFTDYIPKDAGLWCLHGHRHSSPDKFLNRELRTIDVGVDSRLDYSPWSLEEILQIIN